MTDFVDHSSRCTAHVGEIFPVRCRDCDAEAQAARASHDTPTDRLNTHASPSDVDRICDALLTGAIETPTYPPHVRLATLLPADDLKAAWMTHALIDRLVGDVAASRKRGNLEQ